MTPTQIARQCDLSAWRRFNRRNRWQVKVRLPLWRRALRVAAVAGAAVSVVFAAAGWVLTMIAEGIVW